MVTSQQMASTVGRRPSPVERAFFLLLPGQAVKLFAVKFVIFYYPFARLLMLGLHTSKSNLSASEDARKTHQLPRYRLAQRIHGWLSK